MSKKINLKFACPIPWDKMQTVNENERFCSQCQKNIQDFTAEEHPNLQETQCGHFRLDQIDCFKRSYFFGKKQVIAFSIFSLLGLVPAVGLAQLDTVDEKTAIALSKETFQLKGVVRDSRWGHTIEGAKVVALQKDGTLLAEVYTNFNGGFRLDLPSDKLKEGDILMEIYLAGFETKAKNLKNASEDTLVQISLERVKTQRTSPHLESPSVRGYYEGM